MGKIVKTAAILTTITLVAGLILGLVFEVTKEPIAKSQAKAKQEAYQSVMADADEFEAYDGFDEAEAADVLQGAGFKSDEISEVVIAKNGGDAIGCVITVTSKEGYGGDIKMSIGITADGTVAGLEILSISETAGLGMKATEDAFKEQFAGKQVTEFEYTKSGASGDEQIDAISGATITTNAVTNAVNAGLAYYQEMLGGSIDE